MIRKRLRALYIPILVLTYFLAAPARMVLAGSGSLHDALTSVQPGTALRVSLEREEVEGRLVSLQGDTLTLDVSGAQRRVPLAEARDVWRRMPATRQGAIVGGITGGILGAGLGALFYAVVTQGCDTGTCPDYSAAGNVLAGLLGAAGGGAAGALAGGLIGSAVPAWSLCWASEGRSPVSAPKFITQTGPRGFGFSFGVMAGAADCSRDGAPYTRFHLLVPVARRWTLVPEAGLTWVGLKQSSTYLCPGGYGACAWSSERTMVIHGGVAARYSFGRGPARPFLTGGLGGYRWNEGFIGYSLGCGMLLAATTKHPFEVDLRWHANIQRLVEPCPSRLLSLSLGWYPVTWSTGRP
jgi:hypothetical protein